MKKLTLFTLLCLTVTTLHILNAQTLTASNAHVKSSASKALKSPEMSTLGPRFKGGHEALKKFMAEQIDYPETDKKLAREGTVVLQYYINQKGAIENISVVKSISEGLDQEAMRLVKKMPNWEPALQNGRAVRVKYQLPVKFELNF